MTTQTGFPYLSVAIFSRNDDHGGNALRRTQVSFQGLLQQLERHGIESELILVDWNPPPDRPSLKEAVEWPDGLAHCTIRVIEVPPAIHERYPYHEKIPVHATVALNCGIRRARGMFVLPGVIDVLYSDELMAFIASKALRADERYRIDRCDVDRNVLHLDGLTDQLAYCGENIIHTSAFQPTRRRVRRLPQLHTDACGDFQLMSRHYWRLLRGYREADIVAAHVDGLLSYASYAAGVREVILKEPMRLYHIDHDGGFGQRTEVHPPRLEKWVSSLPVPRLGSRILVALCRVIFGDKSRAQVYGIPTLSHSEYLSLCRDMLASKRSYIFNDDAWGLGQEELSETVVCRAEWDG